MALFGVFLKRLPLSSSIIYMAVGIALGPGVLSLIDIRPIDHSRVLEHVAEVGVIISLFSAALKLRTPFPHKRWRIPFRLASGSMVITVGIYSLIGVYLLNLPLGAAILLGAILAPTDPVLASDVQVESSDDKDKLRFSLTGEAGLNDSTAFPFVMLGLGLLGLHDIGQFGWRWIAVDLVWAISSGLVVGYVLGNIVGKMMVRIRLAQRESVGLDDFLALGLIALSYGVTVAIHGYGFLAVFSAGLALRHLEMNWSPDKGASSASEVPTASAQDAKSAQESRTVDPDHAPEQMANAVLGFTEQLERMFEVALVVIIGAVLTPKFLQAEALWFIPLALFVVRPIAVVLGLLGEKENPKRLGLLSWFGIRGIGSVYYLMFAIGHGLPTDLATKFIGLTLTMIAASVVIHGITASPLISLYDRRKRS